MPDGWHSTKESSGLQVKGGDSVMYACVCVARAVVVVADTWCVQHDDGRSNNAQTTS